LDWAALAMAALENNMRATSIRRFLRLVAIALAGALGFAAPDAASAQEAPKPSAAFERFRFSFFDDPDSARDGLNIASLEKLEGAERTRAEDMLIAYLPDDRGVIGLGALRSRRAEPELLRMFIAERQAQHESALLPDVLWTPYTLIDLGKALWRIEPDPRFLAAVIDVLGSAGDSIQRQTAAEALYDVRDRAAVDALIKALDDSEPLVRYHAAHGLLAIYGAPSNSKDLEDMTYRVMAKDAARREGGKRDVLAAIEGRSMLAP
jgi:hypothetical protein